MKLWKRVGAAEGVGEEEERVRSEGGGEEEGAEDTREEDDGEAAMVWPSSCVERTGGGSEGSRPRGNDSRGGC